MLISCHWLRELLDTGDSAPPGAEDISRLLTSLGLEVDAIERVGPGCETVIVGEIRGKAPHPHPKATKLTIVELFDGTDTLQVVCGAPNVPEVGGFVAFAPVGSKLPNGMDLVVREVRGVASHGMICSETELLIGDDGDGIIVLQESDRAPGVRAEFRAGMKLSALVPGIFDEVLELSITPNRPDALGHVGVARDLAVKLGDGASLRQLETQPPAGLIDVDSLIDEGMIKQREGGGRDYPALEDGAVCRDTSLVEIHAPRRCGRYVGHVFTDITVKPSPLWMRVRLNRVGLRAINNCVDITNYILMEQGHPLHVFDRARLAEGRIVVRVAAEGETMTALDGTDVELTENDLVIADATAPQALAGVMGGAGSMVEAGTREVLLEVAYFDPSGIRASARRHGFKTDSSHRFERGVGHGESLTQATMRAVTLLRQLAGGQCRASDDAEGTRPATPKIPLRLARVERVLGFPVSAEEARRTFVGLGIAIVDDADPARWLCTPPSHRPDLGREEDLIEELMRVHGIEDMPARAAVPSAPPAPRRDPVADTREAIIDALAGAGLQELVSFAFTSEEKLARFESEVARDRYVRVANPLRGQHGVMRTHLMPGMLDALAHNVARHGRPVTLFEVGRTYAWSKPGDTVKHSDVTAEIDATLPRESGRAAALLYGGASGRGELGGAPIDAHTACGVLAHALGRVGLSATFVPTGEAGAAADYLHPGIQALAAVDGVVVGRVGEVHPDVLESWDLAGHRVYYGELWLDGVALRRAAKYQAIPRFPATSRDVSIEVPITLPAHALVTALSTAAAAVITDADGDAAGGVRLLRAGAGARSIEVVEDYRGEGVEDGRRAVLLRLHYGADGRSVTDDEVQDVHATIVERACATLRDLSDHVRVR